MQWLIHVVDSVIVMQMRSNLLNKQNDEFFRDLHEAFDRVERDLPARPLVLTGAGHVFSAGLDLEYTFPIFARADEAEIAAWYRRFRTAMLRVFDYPYPTVAAVNGHAVAGGLILALCCDHRIVAQGDVRSGLNEIHVGIPMPSSYTELVRLRCGSPAAIDAILSGTLYRVDEAVAAGFYHEAAASDVLLERARVVARATPSACMEAYAHSKKMLHAPTSTWLESCSSALDADTIRVICSPASRRAQALALERLKGKGASIARRSPP